MTKNQETVGEVFNSLVERADTLASEARERAQDADQEGKIPGTSLSWRYGYNNPVRSDGRFSEDDRIFVEFPDCDRSDVRNVPGANILTVVRIYPDSSAYEAGETPAGWMIKSYRYTFMPSCPSDFIFSATDTEPVNGGTEEYELNKDETEYAENRFKPVVEFVIAQAQKVADLTVANRRSFDLVTNKMHRVMDVAELLLEGEDIDNVRRVYPNVIPQSRILTSQSLFV